MGMQNRYYYNRNIQTLADKLERFEPDLNEVYKILKRMPRKRFNPSRDFHLATCYLAEAFVESKLGRVLAASQGQFFKPDLIIPDSADYKVIRRGYSVEIKGNSAQACLDRVIEVDGLVGICRKGQSDQEVGKHGSYTAVVIEVKATSGYNAIEGAFRPLFGDNRYDRINHLISDLCGYDVPFGLIVLTYQNNIRSNDTRQNVLRQKGVIIRPFSESKKQLVDRVREHAGIKKLMNL